MCILLKYLFTSSLKNLKIGAVLAPNQFTMTTLFDYHLLMKTNPIIARFHICKLKFVHNYKISHIAKLTNTHRNTVSNIIKLFKQKADSFHYQLLFSNPSFDSIIKEFAFLAPKPRKPLSNKRFASY